MFYQRSLDGPAHLFMARKALNSVWKRPCNKRIKQFFERELIVIAPSLLNDPCASFALQER